MLLRSEVFATSAMHMTASVWAAASSARLQHGPGRFMVETDLISSSCHSLIMSSIRHSCSAMFSVCFAQAALYFWHANLFPCRSALEIGLWLVAAPARWVLAAAGGNHCRFCRKTGSLPRSTHSGGDQKNPHAMIGSFWAEGRWEMGKLKSHSRQQSTTTQTACI